MHSCLIFPLKSQNNLYQQKGSQNSYQAHNKWCYEHGVLINACGPEAWGRLITAGDGSSIV